MAGQRGRGELVLDQRGWREGASELLGHHGQQRDAGAPTAGLDGDRHRREVHGDELGPHRVVVPEGLGATGDIQRRV